MPTKKRIFFRILASVIVLLALCGLSIFLGPLLLDYLGRFVSRPITLYQFKNYQKDQLSVLNENKSIWEIQNLENYRLEIQVTANVYNFNPGEIQKTPTCTIQIDVRSKKTASLSSTNCEKQGYASPSDENFIGFWGEGFNIIHNVNTPPIVDDLFVSIKNAFSDLESWCGPNGCECDGYYTYSIEYDPSLGYPKSLKVIHVDPQLGFLFCTLIGTDILLPDYEISVIQLP